MTAMWIGLAAAAAGVLVWRLRRAAVLLERILHEERDAVADGPPPKPAHTSRANPR